jgi:hypothetical protein
MSNFNYKTPEEVAADAGISVRTVARDIAGKSPVLRSVIIFGRRLIAEADAQAYIAVRKAVREAAASLKRA